MSQLGVLAAVLTAGASAESGESSDKAESLSSGIDTIVSALDSAALESALSDDDPFAQTGGFRQTLTAIARGEMTIDFQQTADLLSRQFFSAVRQSLWRLTRLIAPALLWALLKQFSGRSSECGRIVVQLFVCVFLTQDLSDHITLAVATVQQISAGMQGLLPMLLTMMAAVGGSAGSALMQPAVVASASAMTSLISGITVPLAVASGVLCMLCHLGDGIRVQRLAEFTQQCAVWSLGIGFTVFIGVLTTRSVTAAAIDGVTLRTAKYALNNLVPFVGGLFADTVDTLVGSGMLVQSCLGRDGADRHSVPRGAAAVPNAGRRNALQARVRADAAGIRRIARRVHPRFREGADAAVRAAIVRRGDVFDADCAVDCRQRVHDDAAITR